MVPIHASLGLATHLSAIGTILTGLNEIKAKEVKSDAILPDETIVINVIAVVLVAVGILIPFAIRRSNSPASFRVYVSENIWGSANQVGMVREVTEITVTEADGADQSEDIEKY